MYNISARVIDNRRFVDWSPMRLSQIESSLIFRKRSLNLMISTTGSIFKTFQVIPKLLWGCQHDKQTQDISWISWFPSTIDLQTSTNSTFYQHVSHLCNLLWTYSPNLRDFLSQNTGSSDAECCTPTCSKAFDDGSFECGKDEKATDNGVAQEQL